MPILLQLIDVLLEEKKMQVFRSVALALAVLVLHGFSSPPNTQAATPSSDGFGFYSPQIWKNKEGKTAELSICDCGHDPKCFSERILFRKPDGGFLIVPRSELHQDSLNRIDAGLKKLMTQKSLNRSDSDWSSWRGRNGVEMSLKLIAADAEMVAFVDRDNKFKITAIENLDHASKAALAEAAIQKFSKGATRLVAQIDARPYEKKILDGIEARADEIKSIGLKNKVASESEIDAWFLEAKQGITFGVQSVEWKVPVENSESVQGIENDLSALLFNQLFQLVSLPTADFEQLKGASSVKAYKKESQPPVTTPLPPTLPSNVVNGAPGASTNVNEWEPAEPISIPHISTNYCGPSFVQEISCETSELTYASYGHTSCDGSCFSCDEPVCETRCRLIGWLRRLR